MVGATPRGAAAAPLFGLAHLGDGLVGHGAFLLEALRTQWTAAAAGDADASAPSLRAVHAGPHHVALEFEPAAGKTLLATVERVPGACYPPAAAIADDDKERLLHLWSLRHAGAAAAGGAAPTLPLLLSLHDAPVAVVQQTEAPSGHKLALVVEASGSLHVWAYWQPGSGGKTVRLGGTGGGSGKGSHAHTNAAASPTWVRLARVGLQEYLPPPTSDEASSSPLTVLDAHWDGAALLLATAAGSSSSGGDAAAPAAQLWAVPLTMDIAASGRPSADIVVDDALPLLPHAAPLALPASFRGAAAGAPPSRQRVLHPGPAGVWALGSERVLLWPPRAGTVAGAAMPTAHVVAKPLQQLLESAGSPAWGAPAAASSGGHDAAAAAAGKAVLSAAVHASTGELLLLRGDGSLVSLAASRSPGSTAAAPTVDGWQLSCRALSSLERLPALLQRLGAGGVTAHLLPHRQLAVVLLTVAPTSGGGSGAHAQQQQQMLLAHDAATGLLMQGFDLRCSASGAAAAAGNGSSAAGYHLWSAGSAPGGPVAFGVASPASLLTVLEPPVEVYAQRLAVRLAAASSPLLAHARGGADAAADKAQARLASHALRAFLCRAYGGDAAAGSGGNRGDWDGSSLPFTHWGVRYALDWAFDSLTATAASNGGSAGGAFPPTFHHPALASAAAPAPTAVPAFPSLLATAGRLWREIASSSPPLALIFASAAAAAPEAAVASAAGGCAPDSATAVRLLVPLLRILGVRRWAVLQALRGRPVGTGAAPDGGSGGSRAALADTGTSTPGAAIDAWGGAGGERTGLVALASPDEVLALVLKRAHGHLVAASSGGGHHHHHGSHRHVHRASSGGSADALAGKGRSPGGHRWRLSQSEQPAAQQQQDAHKVTGGGRRTHDSDDVLASALAADDAGAGSADGGADHEDGAGAGDMDWVLQRLAGGGTSGGAAAASPSAARSGPSGLRLVEAPPLQPSHASSSGSGSGLPPTGRGGRAGSTAGGVTPGGIPGGVEPLDDGNDDSDAWDEPPPPEFLRFLTPHNVALVPRLLECLRLHSLLLTVLGGVTGTELAGGGGIDAAFDGVQPHAALATALSEGGRGAGGSGALLRAAHAVLQQSVLWADKLAVTAAAADALPPGSAAATAPLLALLPLTAPQPSPHSLHGALRRLRDAEAAATGRPAAAALEVPSPDGGSARVSLGDVYWHGQAVAADGARGALLRQLGVVVLPQASAAHGASTPVGGGDAAAHRTHHHHHHHHHHADPSLLHPSLLEAEPCISLPLGAVPAGVAAARARHALTGGHGHAPAPQPGLAPLSVSPPPPPALELVVRQLYRSGSTRDKRRITALVRRIESALPPAQSGRTPASLASYLHVTQADAGAAAEARRRLVRGTRSAAVRALLALPPDSLVGPYAAATAAGNSSSGSASADGDDAPGSPAVSSPDSDDGVPAAILPHVTLLLELHRGTDAVRVLLRAGCWGAALKMLEAAEDADGYTHGRDAHPLKDVRFDTGGGGGGEGRTASRGLRSAAALAASAAAASPAGSGGTLAQLSASGCLTVGGLADHLQRARGGASAAGGGGGGAKLKPGSDRSSNFAASAVDDDVDVTSAGAGGTDKASVDAAQRRMQAWRQTSTLGMATATASALRWSREAVTRVAHFNALLAAALRDGDARRLEALWRRLPPACTLPSVLASLRAALAEDEADSWAGRIPAGSVLPALEALHAAHCRDMEEQARFWRQHGTVRRVDNVLRGWGASK